jgi:hypothetical protein
MSYNIQGNPKADQLKEIKEAVAAEMKAYQKGQVSSVWYNPATEWTRDEATGRNLRPQTLYVGESSGMAPTWEEPVFDVAVYKTAKKQIASGEHPDKIYNAFIGEWQNKANEYTDTVENKVQYRSAGTITSEDFSALTVLNVAAELLGEFYLPNALEAAVTRVNTPGLLLQIDSYSKFTVSQDVREGEIVPTKKGAFSRQELTLLKDVGHIAITDEAQYRPYPRDIYQIHVRNAVQDLRRIKNRKIATELQTAGSVPAGDWAAYTGEHSARNPMDDIGAIADTIHANGGNANTIVSADRVYRDFVSNTNIKGTTNPVPNTTFGSRVVGNVNGFQWVVDNEMTPTLAVVLDKSAVILAQGPTRTSTYRDEVPGWDGYIVRDWNAVKTIQTGLIRQLTGVSA